VVPHNPEGTGMPMKNLIRIARRAFGAAVLLAACTAAHTTAATPVTIYTYTFEQTDYEIGFGDLPAPGKISGSFAGSLDVNGNITVATLTHFEIQISGFPLIPLVSFLPYSHLDALAFFDFDPTSHATFTFHALMQETGLGTLDTCMGFVTQIYCHVSQARGAVFGLGGVLVKSNAQPQLNLVSVTTTPIPPTLLLLCSGLLGLVGISVAKAKRRTH
jgi:hypothetical protein